MGAGRETRACEPGGARWTCPFSSSAWRCEVPFLLPNFRLISTKTSNCFASENSYVSYREERYVAAAVAAAVGALLALPRLYEALRERLEERLDARRRRLPRTRARSSLPAGRAGEGSDEVSLERANAPFCYAHSFK